MGGYENEWNDSQGNHFSRPDIQRVRHYLLSADVDLTRIHTNNKLLKTVLSLVNMVKIPAPAIELNSLGRVKVHGIYF